MSAQNEVIVYWSKLRHGDWELHLAATEEGLAFVGSRDGGEAEMTAWTSARMPGSRLVRSEEKLHPYADELLQYLEGRRDAFTLPFAMSGTPFQLAVWEALKSIPYGDTESYSGIADRIGRPSAVRAVGAAIGANPVLIAVPCHRVIGKGGALTGYRGGMEMKTTLLELERARRACNQGKA
ncbi:methylated-DNA--[protein]-cysteine S-methyltransferase [Paenibacillus humicus]|uniref:methylated-DNA--[protein]-cysteine S-methyltransferase n=1 Tax=Paenibacillus humicus TaxID=412861 RepID=UPI000FD87CDC|nr:methylated-DNA--[protein]-cysteine S-methyltransferase [Paenibacillus humicus]